MPSDRRINVGDKIVPGIVFVRSITLEGGGQWDNLQHVRNTHRTGIIVGMALVKLMVGNWVKAVGKHHGWCKTRGQYTNRDKKKKANHVTVVL